jgi:uncharacterized protein YggE
MVENVQKQMQVGSWILVGVLALSAIWLTQSIDQMRRSGNVSDVITVTGTGRVTAAPDIAVADLAITVERATAAAAQDEANKKSQAVVDYLTGAGIPEKDIRTSNYNIYPQYDYTDGRSRIRGYQVTQTLEVKIRDLDKANTVLDGVVDAGVNQVNNFRFDIDDPEELKAEARAKAIADANEKAHQLKSQLGVRLGRIVSFSEDTGGYPPPYFLRSEAGGFGGDAMSVKAMPAPAVPTGENEVVVNVSITYQIR